MLNEYDLEFLIELVLDYQEVHDLNHIQWAEAEELVLKLDDLLMEQSDD